MNVQLLLLLALAGPFCAFTHASPTGLPVTDEPGTSDQPPERLFSTVQAVIDDTTMNMNHVVTGPPTTAPETAPAEATNAPTMPAAPAFTTEQVVETDAPVPASTAAPQPLITDPPAVETAAPTDPATAEDQTQATGAAKIDTGDDVVVEGDTVDGLSSGQVVGIVIGALLAVVIVIAVVIAVVRRMGKYSSAKKKPAKKDSAMVSPLRRKSAKQQERSKFWKF